MWVARWDITTPESCKKVVEHAKKYNFNALFVQVRGRGDAFYKSHFEPRAEDLEGQPESFDPLAVILEEGHKQGLQVHAWLNTHFTWGSASKPKSPEHIVNKHPDWLMHTRDGEVTYTAIGQSEGAYTCPSNPEVKEHVKNCFLDVVKNYDVDGVHFDFVRYPSTEYCYCDGCLQRFKVEVDKTLTPEEKLVLENFPGRIGYTLAFPDKWDTFRRQQITDLVSATYKAAHKEKPGIIVSAAVFPSFDDAYNYRFQNWKKWLEMGALDLLCPMAYTKDTKVFTDQIKDALSAANGRPIYAGIGSWQITPDRTFPASFSGSPLNQREAGRFLIDFLLDLYQIIFLPAISDDTAV